MMWWVIFAVLVMAMLVVGSVAYIMVADYWDRKTPREIGSYVEEDRRWPRSSNDLE